MRRGTSFKNLTRSRRIREQHKVFKQAMLSLRILLLIVVARAADRQEQQQRYRYESLPARMTSSHRTPSYSILLPYPYYAHDSPSHRQWTFQKPTHQFQHLQTGNGNGLAETEIAMEILSESLPLLNIPAHDDVEAQSLPKPKEDVLDFWRRQHNFRVTKLDEQPKKTISKNSHWNDETLFGDDIATSPLVAVNDDYAALGSQGTQLNDTADISNELQLTPKVTGNSAPEEMDNFGEVIKRTPIAIERYQRPQFREPHYATTLQRIDDNDSSEQHIAKFVKLRSSKRERPRTTRPTFLPSISAGALTHLGNFFDDLSKNVHFNEQHELHDPETKLLEGNHPLRMLQHDIHGADDETKIDKTAKFLQAIRTYRPSQKIRSLVSMNPQGYHGSNFLDPNYMWVGLG